ncbi:hypothetical protein M422DRAFT_54137 [Sphaerobolus stellatus SS14]|uniref:Uncharacterized protein n=1 Tax=Sphaerobolus stellatus (strain SS14) TaxID=990650 RepID=A0A0C9UW34_SPHS4|nr:hypothetical protein M422DRAFT_54137 [Sphaerobolus stellatus SS14]
MPFLIDDAATLALMPSLRNQYSFPPALDNYLLSTYLNSSPAPDVIVPVRLPSTVPLYCFEEFYAACFIDGVRQLSRYIFSSISPGNQDFSLFETRCREFFISLGLPSPFLFFPDMTMQDNPLMAPMPKEKPLTMHSRLQTRIKEAFSIVLLARHSLVSNKSSNANLWVPQEEPLTLPNRQPSGTLIGHPIHPSGANN